MVFFVPHMVDLLRFKVPKASLAGLLKTRCSFSRKARQRKVPFTPLVMSISVHPLVQDSTPISGWNVPRHGRYPTFWVDKFCIDQAELADGLRLLPVNAACRQGNAVTIKGPLRP